MPNELPSLIPLFPLPNAVMFPRMPLPLHVFEQRYREMVRDVMDSHRVIGMVLLQPGWEADYEGRPPVYPVGCAGHVERCEAAEHGRYNIVLKGLSRFRILEEHPGELYRVASVEPLADATGEIADLDAARRRLLAAIGRAADGPTALVLQNDLPHEVFLNALCQSLPLSSLEQQSLLDCDGLGPRYERLLEVLEFRRLERTAGSGSSVH